MKEIPAKGIKATNLFEGSPDYLTGRTDEKLLIKV